MVDTKKLEAAGQAALADVNKTEGWIDTHPRLAAVAAFVAGGVVEYLLHLVHVFK